MIIEIKIPDSIKLSEQFIADFTGFLQAVTNRACQGYIRYGKHSRLKKYFSRLTVEVKTYKRTGNFEQLLNTAVYCFLESEAPENKKFHFDATIESVTRNGKTL